MKKTKILAPALGILALSLAASVTGTVAWFSTNASVSAEGMAIKAQVATNLYIDTSAYNTTTGVFSAPRTASAIIADHKTEIAPIVTNVNSSSLTFVNTNMIPTSTSDLINWAYVNDNTKVDDGGEVFDSSASHGLEAGTLASIAVGATEGGDPTYLGLSHYVVVGQLSIALADVETKTLSMECFVDENNADSNFLETTLLGAVRVVVVWEAESDVSNVVIGEAAGVDCRLNKMIFNGTEADRSAYVIKDDLSVDTAATVAYASSKKATDKHYAKTLGTMAPQVTYTATIYAYFEGQDSACYNVNSIYAGDYSISFEFAIA